MLQRARSINDIQSDMDVARRHERRHFEAMKEARYTLREKVAAHSEAFDAIERLTGEMRQAVEDLQDRSAD